MQFKETFVVDNYGEKIAVMLPIKEYNKLIAELEDAEDIKAYRKVKAMKSEVILFDRAVKEIAGNRKRKND
ncbi:MAG: hypothetical protein ABI723_14625 [Bacteroidia bacterium]